MEYLYDKSNDYLKGKEYVNTAETKLLEKIADYIYDKTSQSKGQRKIERHRY